jgi:hypothetical protein
MKKNILLFMALTLCVNAPVAAQSVEFVYDEAGNRISRTIVLATPNLRSGATDTDATSPLEEQPAAGLQLVIYPNPTAGLLQVELSGMATDETAQLALFDLQGENLLQTTVTSQIVPVDMSKYPAGVYLLRLTLRGRPTDYKIVKQ